MYKDSLQGDQRYVYVPRRLGLSGEQIPREWLVTQRRQLWRPPTDVYETDDAIVVKVEIAGMDKDDFDISLVDHTLIISGQRQDPADKLAYQQMEISYGEFRTEVYLSWPLDVEKVQANYEAGFLYVILPKVKSVKKVLVTNG